MKKTVFLNGKFLNAPRTGVQRVARELIRAIDQMLLDEPNFVDKYQFILATPKHFADGSISSRIQAKQFGWFNGIPWEQIDLPMALSRQFILNLCNLGPVWHKNAITMIHDAQVYSFPSSYKLYFRLSYKVLHHFIQSRHRHIITVSEYSKNDLVRFGVAPVDKITVIQNGVDHVLRVAPDHEAMQRYHLSSRKFVLALANVQPHKNVKILLDAFHDKALSDITLVLFGTADQEALERCGRRRLPPNVMLVGMLSDGELRALMEKAVCLAFPSRTEGFGLPPLEAMLLGCPAIVAPCGALPEMCGDAAVYADPDDESAWVNSIRCIADNQEHRSALGAQGILQARKYNWNASAKKLLTLLDKEIFN